MVGAGFTRSWMQIFIPAAEWINYDPTNKLVSDSRLIRVALVRHPALALSFSGSWYATPGDSLRMTATVQVRRRNKDVQG